jgi:hypothetical protein
MTVEHVAVSKAIASERDLIAEHIIKELEKRYTNEDIIDLERRYGTYVPDVLYNVGVDYAKDIKELIDLPLEDLPLHINANSRFCINIIKWRLSVGK